MSLETVGTRGVTVNQTQITTYMSNPISPQETQITNALANGLVAMGQRTDALHTKIARLEYLVDRMKTILHASLLAANKTLPSIPRIAIDGFDAGSSSDPPASAPHRIAGPDPTEVSSDPSRATPFTIPGNNRQSSTSDFMALMNTIKPEAGGEPDTRL